MQLKHTKSLIVLKRKLYWIDLLKPVKNKGNKDCTHTHIDHNQLDDPLPLKEILK